MDTYKRLFTAPKGESYFLWGPRSTGKSTLLKTLYPNAFKIDLLLPTQLRKFLTHPESLIETVDAEEDKNVFVIDEIQRAPDLLSVVHYLIEERSHRKLQFILTGSSARKLKKGGADLLGGRALRKHLYPFIPSELGKDFSLKESLQYGLIPLIHASKSKSAKLDAYIDLYLKEEVKSEGLVKDISSFSRFLEAMSFSHAEILNISNISRECQVERKSVERYVEVLEDTLIGERVPVYSKNPKREVIAHSKFYFFDTGIFKKLIPSNRKEEFSKGQALEGLFYQILRAHLSYANENEQLYFWRSKSNNEVDFIFQHKEKTYAIEVKSSPSLHPADFSGIKSFRDDYPESKCFLVYTGNEKLLKSNVLCVPAEDFLKKEILKIFS